MAETKEPRNVIEMVREYLEQNGCDGLCNLRLGCSCTLGNLLDCWDPEHLEDCVAGVAAKEKGTEK